MRILRQGAELKISATKPRVIFAMLSMFAGSLLSTDQMVDELWPERPPSTASRTVQTYVYQIRKAIGAESDGTGPPGPEVLTRPGGYEFQLGSNSFVDFIRFGELLEIGREKTAHHRPHEASAALREALTLWRGKPFSDLPVGPALTIAQTRLEQMRKNAQELQIDVELGLGHHHDIVDPLRELVLLYPDDEGFAARSMTALLASGRRGEAIDVYHRLRQRLHDDFGLIPSPDVQRLFHSALNDEAPVGELVPAPATVTAMIRQRPEPPCPALVGREDELARLRSALLAPAAPQAAGFRAVEVIGGPGTGTSAFVLRAGHEASGDFRDRFLYVDLQGVRSQDPVSVRLLSDRLSAAGVPLDGADDLDRLAAQFCGWSIGRHLLVIADHSVCARVLSTIRPAGWGSAMIVVNQFCAPGQIGDALIELGPLPDQKIAHLLRQAVGAWRLDREPTAVRRLTQLCEGNPLIARATARWLACRPSVQIGRLVREAEAEPARLVRLWWAGQAVENSVHTRIKQLSPDATQVLLILAGGPDSAAVEPGTVERRLGWSSLRLESTLDELTDAQLVSAEAAPLDGARRQLPPLRHIVRWSLLGSAPRPLPAVSA